MVQDISKKFIIPIAAIAFGFASLLPAARAEKLSVASPLKIQKKAAEPGDSTTLLKQGRIETRLILPSKTSIWHKNYTNGMHSLNARRFGHSEMMLLAAIKSAKGPSSKRLNLVKSRLALGRLYLAQRRFKEANEVYRITLSKAKGAFGDQSVEVAECLYGLARTEVHFNEIKKAKENAEQAIEILKAKGKVNTQLFGKTLNTLGLVMAKFGWYEDSKKLFEPSLAIMKTHPGHRKIDLAEVMIEQSLFYHQVGMKRKSADLYEEAYKIKERFVQPDKQPSVVGKVTFRWQQGSTRSKEIIDNEFPFRFLSAKGVRVAATVIDLWELLGVLVTVTNLNDHQQKFDLGEVVLVKVDKDNPKRREEVIPNVDAESIDKVQKELSMWALTHGRPWLANIQKTRTVRGLVPFKGHDLFRGPNVFGVYGKWKAVSHTVPQRVGLNPSRERVLDRHTKAEVPMPGLLKKGNAQFKGIYPVWLEPFESRTGELFYLNPRDCDVVVKVPVGNAVFELPFHTRKKFPH